MLTAICVELHIRNSKITKSNLPTTRHHCCRERVCCLHCVLAM